MLLARILSKIYKEDGIILIDAKGQKYICGNPNKKKPIILKLLRENLKWKLIVDPEIEFPMHTTSSCSPDLPLLFQNISMLN